MLIAITQRLLDSQQDLLQLRYLRDRAGVTSILGAGHPRLSCNGPTVARMPRASIATFDEGEVFSRKK